MQAGYIAEKPLGYFQSAAGNIDTAKTLANLCGGSLPPGASMAVITVGAQAVRYRDDGTAPTAAIGMPLAVGATITVTQRNLASLTFIAQVAGATLDISIYGQGN